MTHLPTITRAPGSARQHRLAREVSLILFGMVLGAAIVLWFARVEVERIQLIPNQSVETQ